MCKSATPGGVSALRRRRRRDVTGDEDDDADSMT